MNENSKFVELDRASVVFGRRVALSDVSLDISRGDFVVLQGPTGCGKSVILKLICGLILPTSGSVRIVGESTSSLTAEQRRTLRHAIGLMLQNMPLLEDRTILENVMLPAMAARQTTFEARRRATYALERCKMGEFARARPIDLSSGQRQVVSLARAVVNEPAIVLADEPAANLDGRTAQNLLNLLGEFSTYGITVVMSTHLSLVPENTPHRSVKFQAKGAP